MLVSNVTRLTSLASVVILLLLFFDFLSDLIFHPPFSSLFTSIFFLVYSNNVKKCLHLSLLNLHFLGVQEYIHSCQKRIIYTAHQHSLLGYLVMGENKAVLASKPDHIAKSSKTKSRARLSRWFVNNQKNQAWDENALNTLHIRMLVLMSFVYLCHIVGSPFIRFVRHQNALVAIYVLETLALIVSIFCFFKMRYVNGSWTATKFMFHKKSIRTYVFVFWLLRCFVIEILKGQVIYSFVVSFHSIMIFSTDTWYMCDRKTLIASMVLYILMLVYEFFVSISPVSPKTPSWTYMHIETNANSLSRSNYFNLFVIFLDALIVVIYDVNRSKYVMMVKKSKREMLEVSPSKEHNLTRLWICVAVTFFLGTTTFIMEASSGFFSGIHPELYNILLGIFGSTGIFFYIVILYFSSSSTATRTLHRLMHERRVIFIVLLLGILYYVDNVYKQGNVDGVIFPIVILLLISFDLIVMCFPRRLALVTMIIVVLLLCWNIVENTFLRTDCKQYMLPWGIFGESISA